jgi:glycosyltransferase involved in cell wall biosynthesis
MTDRKTVVVFGSYAPSLIIFRGPLIAAIIGRGHRVFAVAPNMDAETDAALRKMGAEPYEIQFSNQSLNPLPTIRAFFQFRKFLRARRPDALITYTIKPVIIGALAAAAEGVSNVVSLVTGVGYPFGTGNEAKRRAVRVIARQLYRLAFRRTAWVVFQNPDDEMLFRRIGLLRGRQKVGRINGSGVDLDYFTVAPQPSSVSFLMISRLLKHKGLVELAAATRRLKAEHPEVSVHLVGYIDSSPDAITETELQEFIASGIQFDGRMKDVRPAIRAASVSVLPSYYPEGTPRSLLEGMAMGRAIITTDAPGCRETVRDEVNGLLLPPRDVDALFKAMVRFAKDPGLAVKMGKESRKFAEEKFDVNRVNDDLIRMAEL